MPLFLGGVCHGDTSQRQQHDSLFYCLHHTIKASHSCLVLLMLALCLSGLNVAASGLKQRTLLPSSKPALMPPRRVKKLPNRN